MTLETISFCVHCPKRDNWNKAFVESIKGSKGKPTYMGECPNKEWHDKHDNKYT